MCVPKGFILEQSQVSPSHGCQWGQVSVTVSLVIPALGCMECCSPFLLVVLPWTPMGRKNPDTQVPPCWLHPSSGREVAQTMEPFPVSFFFPLGITMGFESELVCLGSTALAKPGACVRGSGWLRARCWLVSKGFLSPKNSLITGIKLVPAKHQGGQLHPFLAGCLPPSLLPIPSILIRSVFLWAKTNSGESK